VATGPSIHSVLLWTAFFLYDHKKNAPLIHGSVVFTVAYGEEQLLRSQNYEYMTVFSGIWVHMQEEEKERYFNLGKQDIMNSEKSIHNKD
jgi:hypothetical protein